MRTPFVAANWKMYKTVARGGRLRRRSSAASSRTSTTSRSSSRRRSRRVHAVAEAAREHATSASPAQDLYWEREGAFTGEVSAGDAEGGRAPSTSSSATRSGGRLFGETDAHVNRKVKAALAAGLTPIVCIGETLEEREAQPDARGARPADAGAGSTASRPTQVGGARHRVRAGLGDRHRAERDGRAGAGGARAHPRRGCASGSAPTRPTRCHVLYGGSVKPDNIARAGRASRTWTARWSAARASTSAGFAEIVAASRPGRI